MNSHILCVYIYIHINRFHRFRKVMEHHLSFWLRYGEGGGVWNHERVGSLYTGEGDNYIGITCVQGPMNLQVTCQSEGMDSVVMMIPLS